MPNTSGKGNLNRNFSPYLNTQTNWRSNRGDLNFLVKRLKNENYWVRGVDIKKHEYTKSYADDFIKGDFLDAKIHDKIYAYFDKKIDVVISDMAVNTTGNKNLDSYRTGELCLKAMSLAQKILHKDGVFLSKLFMGSIFAEIQKMADMYFKKVIKYKPISSKKESKEIYIYCQGI